MTIPTIGRAVHFYSRDMEGRGANKDGRGLNGIGPYAAIITSVHASGGVNLQVFPIGLYVQHLNYAEGTIDSGLRSWWQWPEWF